MPDKSLSGARILLCEDEALAAIALRMTLNQLGAEVETVARGEEAVAAAAGFAPDLVLMDIGLPGISGLEAMLQIKQQLDTCVFMFSAYADERTIAEAFDAGADGYLVKPIAVAEVVGAWEERCKRVKQPE